jgi:aryl carrier-like protein
MVAKVLGEEAGLLTPEVSLYYYGLDSLKIAELKNCFEADLFIDVPLLTLMEGPSLIELSRVIQGCISSRFAVN